MREYVDKRPYLIIGGRVDDYLGEYMAGGVIVVLGIDALDREVELTGRYVGSGMVGGRIYVRGRLPRSRIGLQPSRREIRLLVEALREGGIEEVDDWFRRIFHVGHAPRPSAEYRELTEEEARELEPVITEYLREFNIEMEPTDLLGLKYTVVKPGLKEGIFEGIVD
jgi:glutamate synthase domain-containing protein 3